MKGTAISSGTDDAFVAAIPQALAETFDFNSFLAEAQSRNAEKRTETQYLQLPEWDSEAKELACALAGLRYGWTSEKEILIIPTNADKNRSDIMEDIIRDAGQTRGGTIRSFVRECLDNSGTHIVPSKEVYEYVRQFRPTSSDENIITNLMLETDKPFRIIWKDGVSFFSYSSEPIPDGYKQITRTFAERRSFEESIALLDKFISLNGRMPKICDDPEQTRLARFLTTLRSLRRRGLLPQKEMEELQRIEAKANGGGIQLELF